MERIPNPRSGYQIVQNQLVDMFTIAKQRKRDRKTILANAMTIITDYRMSRRGQSHLSPAEAWDLIEQVYFTASTFPE